MRNILAAAALVTAGLAGSAGAATVTIDFVATGFTGTSASLLALVNSAPVTGRLTYDEATRGDAGSYYDSGVNITSVYFLGSLSVTVNGTTYVSTPPTSVFSNDTDSNVDWVDTQNSFRFFDNLIAIEVRASGATTWDGVTPTVAQLNAATSRQALFSIGGDSALATNVTFSSPVVPPIPLPAGGVLLVSAIGGLALIRRRRALSRKATAVGSHQGSASLQAILPV